MTPADSGCFAKLDDGQLGSRCSSSSSGSSGRCRLQLRSASSRRASTSWIAGRCASSTRRVSTRSSPTGVSARPAMRRARRAHRRQDAAGLRQVAPGRVDATFPIGAQPGPQRCEALLPRQADGAARASTDMGKVERPQAATTEPAVALPRRARRGRAGWGNPSRRRPRGEGSRRRPERPVALHSLPLRDARATAGVLAL